MEVWPPVPRRAAAYHSLITGGVRARKEMSSSAVMWSRRFRAQVSR